MARGKHAAKKARREQRAQLENQMAAAAKQVGFTSENPASDDDDLQSVLKDQRLAGKVELVQLRNALAKRGLFAEKGGVQESGAQSPVTSVAEDTPLAPMPVIAGDEAIPDLALASKDEPKRGGLLALGGFLAVVILLAVAARLLGYIP